MTRSAILTPVELAAIAPFLRSADAPRRAQTIGRRMRRAIPTAYTPGAYGWSSQIGTLKSAADGSLWVTIEDDAFTRLDSRARALFVATDADIAAWLAASEAVIDGSG